jgi:hypothetical protein
MASVVQPARCALEPIGGRVRWTSWAGVAAGCSDSRVVITGIRRRTKARRTASHRDRIRLTSATTATVTDSSIHITIGARATGSVTHGRHTRRRAPLSGALREDPGATPGVTDRYRYTPGYRSLPAIETSGTTTAGSPDDPAPERPPEVEGKSKGSVPEDQERKTRSRAQGAARRERTPLGRGGWRT